MSEEYMDHDTMEEETASTPEEGRFDTSRLDIPLDDFTREDERANRKANKASNKAIGDTLEGPSSSKSAKKSASRIKGMVTLGAAYAVLRTHKTKKLNREVSKMTEEAEKLKEHLDKGEAPTFSDAFAAALKKYNYEDKTSRLQKVQQRLMKRQNFDRKVGEAIRAFTGAATNTARIAGMKYTADAMLTGRSGGADASDIANKGSQREVPEFDTHSDDAEYEPC